MGDRGYRRRCAAGVDATETPPQRKLASARAGLEFPLHEVALQAARSLPSGAFAVAVTGSVARGNWHALASDVDLWVLGRRSARIHTHCRGHPVTYLMETPRRAASFPVLCRCEVEDIWVLHDPGGHFAAIKAQAAQQRACIREAITRATVVAFQDSVERSAVSEPAGQICWLRDAAWRAIALEAFRRRGWRTPNLRHVRELLARPQFLRLNAILGLPLSRATWQRLQSCWRPFVRGFARTRPAATLSPILKDSEHLFFLARHGSQAEAVFEARRALEAHLPRRVWLALQGGREPPRSARPADASVYGMWRILHGFVPAAPGADDARRIRAALAELIRDLALDDPLLPTIGMGSSRTPLSTSATGSSGRPTDKWVGS